MLGSLFSFRGRMRSQPYLIISLVGALLILLMEVGLKHRPGPHFMGWPRRDILMWALAVMVAGSAAFFAIAWSGLAITVKRLRDIGAPIFLGLLALVAFTAGVQWLTGLVSHMAFLSKPLADALPRITATATTVVLALWPTQRDAAAEAAEVFGDADDDAAARSLSGMKAVRPRAQFGLRRRNMGERARVIHEDVV